LSTNVVSQIYFDGVSVVNPHDSNANIVREELLSLVLCRSSPVEGVPHVLSRHPGADSSSSPRGPWAETPVVEEGLNERPDSRASDPRVTRSPS
jgi:hypothetical protein